MVADGLLTRQRYREVPPRVDYELTERARDLMPVVGALAPLGLRLGVGRPAPGRGDRHRRDPALRPGPRCPPASARHASSCVVDARRRRASDTTSCTAAGGTRDLRGARARPRPTPRARPRARLGRGVRRRRLAHGARVSPATRALAETLLDAIVAAAARSRASRSAAPVHRPLSAGAGSRRTSSSSPPVDVRVSALVARLERRRVLARSTTACRSSPASSVRCAPPALSQSAVREDQ